MAPRRHAAPAAKESAPILDSETAAMFRPTSLRFAIPCLLVPVCAAAAFVAAAATPTTAGVNWHPDLEAARAASATSQKPVLAIFIAGWSAESTRFAEHTLTSPEATALIAACFEPVCVDVDAQPELTRRLRVAHVPSACVVAADDVPLAAFDCPQPPPAFVVAAARAAQDAAVVAATTTANPRVERVVDSTLPAGRASADLSAVGFAGTAPVGDAGSLPGREAISPGRGSISLVTAKVRQLASFASGSTPPTAAPGVATAVTPTLPVAAPMEAAPTANRLVVATTAEPPALPKTPPTWPAEAPAAAPAFTNAVVPKQRVRDTIEPVQATPSTAPASPATTPASWLASPAVPAANAPPTATPAGAVNAAAPPAEPESSAVVSDMPAKTAKPSGWSSFVTAMQKPFTAFTKPVATIAAKPAAPPTVPPPRPTSATVAPAQPSAPLAQQPAAPVAPAAPVHPPAAAPAAAPETASVPDPYGSMPLGLEGYCPVTLADRSVWTEGRAQWGVRHRGRTYLFAGPEQQQAFLANPDRYAPALSGDDPVLAIDQGRTAPGRRAYGVTYQSRMYLFSSPETKAAFASNPDRYTSSVTLAEQPAQAGGATRRY